MITSSQYQGFMPDALAAAIAAAEAGDVPVGAVIVAADGQFLAKAGNRVERDQDPTAHAEILAIREATQKLKNQRLDGCDLWVTLEPCAMCAGAISQARIRRLYIGALDDKSGGVFHGAKVFAHKQCHHVPDIYDGLMADASADLLKQFFASRR
ncbi:MAG: nucleoside deaminase [Alphaproteobacteria bacterium]|nr:nucleoside deaminase [Alphaproteobacteria bacterium]